MGVKPFRGDQVAAGVVVLAVLVVLLNVRMGWGGGVHLAYTLAAAAGCAVLGFPVRRRPDQHGPRAWETTIVVVCWLLTAVASVRLLDLVSEDDPGPGAWTLVLLALGALGLAIAARGAATGALLAASGFGGAVLAFAFWVGDPSGDVLRLLLLVELVVFVFLVVAHRDRRPHQAAQLANAAALAALGIAAVGLTRTVGILLVGDLSDGVEVVEGPGWGWDLVLLVAGFGAIGFGAIDRHRGPVLLGALVLAGFVATVPDGDLLGWPLLLALAAAFLLVVGLRPSTELPPPPDEEGIPVEPLPLR